MRFLLTCCLLALLTLPAPAQDQPDPGTQGKLSLTIDSGRHNSTILRAFFNPRDGNQLITLANDGAVRLWDVAESRATSVIYPPGVPYVKPAALSQDGKRLAVPARYFDKGKEQHVIHVLSLPDGRLERTLRGDIGPVRALAFSPDSKRLASARTIEPPEQVRLWDLTGDAPPVMIGKNKRVVSLAFSPDGKRLACGARVGKVPILDLASGTETEILGREVAWSPDGRTIATALDQDLRLYDSTGRLLHARVMDKGQCMDLAFSPDSKTVLYVFYTSANGHLAILMDVATGNEVLRFQPKPAATSTHSASGAFSPDGQLAATVGGESVSEMLVWQTKDGAIHREVTGLAWMFGGAGSVKPAWSKSGTAVCWHDPWVLDDPHSLKKPMRGLATFDLVNLQFIKTLQAEERYQEVSQQDGLTLKRLEYNLFEVVKEGKPLDFKLSGERPKFIGKGRVALDGGRFTRHISLVDALTGKEIRRLLGAAPIYGTDPWGMHPSPDNRLLMTLHTNQTLSIWNLEQQKPLLTLYRKGQDWAIWTEEGYYAATPGGEQLIGWKVDNGIDRMPTYYPAEQFRKQLYRPDVIKLILEKGSVAEALKSANAALLKQGIKVAPVVSTPEKLLPPGVTITVDQTKLPTVTVKVHARAAVAEQPIISLRLMVDGLRLPDGEGYVEFESGKEKAEYQTSWTVKLPAGPHRLSVLALSKDYTPNLSNPVFVRCPTVGNDRPALHHVAVGVSEYRQVTPNLKFADKDARELKRSLHSTTKNGLAYRHGESFELVNAEATRDAVLNKIDAIRKNAKPGDLLVLSFAGHGVREEGEFYLLTHEADTTSAATLKKTAISGSALRDKLATFPCQVLILLDACHAGAVGGLAAGSDDAARSLSDVDLRVAVMCAALGHEKAREENGNGLFTSALIRALQRDPEAFFDRATGEMTVYHLTAFVEQEVRKRSDGAQNPYLKMPLAHPAFNVTQFTQGASGIQK